MANQTVVSVDATVNTDGTLTLVSADLLDAAPQDEVEGTLLANGVAGQFFLVVSNKVVATGNSTLASANVGDTFLVTLSNPLFIVDTDEFFNNASLPPSSVTTLFSSEADLVDGQDVMVHVTAATGTAAGGDQAIRLTVCACASRARPERCKAFPGSLSRWAMCRHSFRLLPIRWWTLFQTRRILTV